MSEVVSFRNELYNIVHLDNVPSIIQHGILCHKLAAKHVHTSVALEGVQQRRAIVSVPQGKKLHEYANLYINARNPMMSRIRAKYLELCVLSISAQVLQLPDVVVSDMNAACDMCRFVSYHEALRELNFTMIYARYWTHPDKYQTDHHKHVCGAEVLVPERISYSYVTKAYVAEEIVKANLSALGFNKPIEINPDMFFRY